MHDAVPPIPQCLWTTVCPNCGYPLTGLPDEGMCPECGAAYDQSEVILYGWGRGQHENVATAKRSRMIWLLIVPLAWILIQLWPMSQMPRSYFPGEFPIIASVALFALVRGLFQRRATQHPGAVQIRLNHLGCVQYDNLAGPSLAQRLWASHSWLAMTAVAVGLIILRARADIGVFPFCFLLVATLLFIPIRWKAGRRYYQAARLIPDHAIADANAALVERVPWKNIADYQLDRLRRGGHRLRINAKLESFALADRSKYPVDAEINCDAEQIEQLRTLISQWMAHSRQPSA